MDILHTELRVKSLALRNRIVMPPMATPKPDDDGLATDAVCAYYQARSRGIGLLITEHCYVNLIGKAHRTQLSIADDSVIGNLKKLTDAVHRNGTAVFAQLSHAGGRTFPAVTGFEAVAPSHVELPGNKKDAPVAREITAGEIQDVVADFAAAAVRAKEAGYDGVEIHSAHGYLLNQFFSPIANHRTDDYTGATLEGRLRMHREVLAAVRKVVGEDYPVAMRLAASDFIEGGIVPEDAAAAGKLLEQAGLDILDISGGFMGFSRPGHTESGYFRDLSRTVRQNVTIPVIVTGGVTTGAQAEELLEAGDADLIGVGRALMRDPDWAQKNL